MKDLAERAHLSQWLHTDLRERFHHRIVGIADEVAIQWGEIRGFAQQEGKSLSVVDSLIAATANCYSAAVVTRNIAGFQDCGCEVINPWDIV